MTSVQRSTYAGICQSKIVANLKSIAAFINKIDISGAKPLKDAASLMLAPGGYIDRVDRTVTGAELAQAIREYTHPEMRDVVNPAHAIEEVLQTYAGVRLHDNDPLCEEAVGILEGWRAWGGMPQLGGRGTGDAAQRVFEAKLPAIKACDGMFPVLPASTPQLGYTYCIHPKRGVTRDALAEEIAAFLTELETADPSLSSELPPYRHIRLGPISQVEGSPKAVQALHQALAAKGLVGQDAQDACENIGTPADKNPVRANFTRDWSQLYGLYASSDFRAVLEESDKRDEEFRRQKEEKARKGNAPKRGF